MTFQEMEQILIDKNDNHYKDIIVPFTFCGQRYETSINYAYLNGRLDEIYRKYQIMSPLVYDETWMWTKTLDAKTYKSEMNKIVKRLYNQRIDKLIAEDILTDVLELIDTIIVFLDAGSKISLDLSLIGLIKDMFNNPEIYDLMTKQHVTTDMTPEQIYQKRKELIEEIKRHNFYGVSELLKSGAGAKVDQVFNCLFGLWLRPRVKNMNEMTPQLLLDRWIDGISTREAHFIETNNNRKAAILSKQTIKESGKESKWAGVLSQDIYISGKDCGSIYGIKYEVKDERDLMNAWYKYRITENGTLTVVTPDDTHLIGTSIYLRSVLLCANVEGICETCFGEHAIWNMNTEKYRKDLGSEFVKIDLTEAGQNLLSVKHLISPEPLPVTVYITNLTTGEVTTDTTGFLTRNIMEIKLDKDVTAYFYAKDITNKVFSDRNRGKTAHVSGNVIYNDTDYDEYDIIRVKEIYIEKNKVRYKLHILSDKTKSAPVSREIDFKIKGFPDMNILDAGTAPIIINGHFLTYVIPNLSKTTKFKNLKALYTSESTPVNGAKPNSNKLYFANIDDLVTRAREVLPDSHMASIEVLFRNKIKSRHNVRKRPDWTKPGAMADAVILTEQRALHALNSVSVKLGLGWFKRNMFDPYFYNPNNLVASSYDRLLDSSEEINARHQYREVTEEDDIDFLTLYEEEDDDDE